jgi:exodeoxyribonuclease III
MKLISWNVNGIRSVQRYGFSDWFSGTNADFVCVQETKAHPDQIEEQVLHPNKCHSYWASAEKKGYSGVAIFAKKEPQNIKVGIDLPEADNEGRVITLEYDQFFLVNSYFPNSQRDHARLNFKMQFCDQMLKYIDKLHKKNKDVILCGDFNISHQEIDLKNPKSNMKNAGFLPEERAWMDKLLKKNWVDTFRVKEKGPGFYTWWSYRPGVREKNIGWRLDYFVANGESQEKIKSVTHQTKVMGSDHCPVELILK